jgi:hypothetical protein
MTADLACRNRARGPWRFSLPTPPYMRVRIRRFHALNISAHSVLDSLESRARRSVWEARESSATANVAASANPVLEGSARASDCRLRGPIDSMSLYSGQSGRNRHPFANSDACARIFEMAAAICSISLRPPNNIVCVNHTASPHSLSFTGH